MTGVTSPQCGLCWQVHTPFVAHNPPDCCRAAPGDARPCPHTLQQPLCPPAPRSSQHAPRPGPVGQIPPSQSPCRPLQEAPTAAAQARRMPPSTSSKSLRCLWTSPPQNPSAQTARSPLLSRHWSTTSGGLRHPSASPPAGRAQTAASFPTQSLMVSVGGMCRM